MSEDGSQLSIWQMTKSHLLPTYLQAITDIAEDRTIIAQYLHNIGSINFTGDVIVYNRNQWNLMEDGNFRWNEKLPEEESKGIKRIIEQYRSSGRRFMLITQGFRDDLLAGINKKIYVNAMNSNEMKTELGISGRLSGGDFGAHVLNRCTSLLHERADTGTMAAVSFTNEHHKVFEKDLQKYGERVERVADNIIVLKNATAEATKGQFQVYF